MLTSKARQTHYNRRLIPTCFIQYALQISLQNHFLIPNWFMIFSLANLSEIIFRFLYRAISYYSYEESFFVFAPRIIFCFFLMNHFLFLIRLQIINYCLLSEIIFHLQLFLIVSLMLIHYVRYYSASLTTFALCSRRYTPIVVISYISLV